MPRVLLRREWAISHGLIFAGLVLVSLAIYMLYGQSPVFYLSVWGLWLTAGGVCYTIAYLAIRLSGRTRSEARGA